MHLALNRLMFLTYQASDFNNWEKWEILFYVFIIRNGRFSFKLNFIPGWNSTRFIPGCKQKFVHPRTSFIRGWDFISVTCKRTLNLLIKPFRYMTKTSRQKLKYLENEKSFWAEIKSIFHHLRTYLMDDLFLNQKTNKTFRMSYSLKYKHSKKKILYEKINDSVVWNKHSGEQY